MLKFYYHCILDETEAIESMLKATDDRMKSSDFHEMDYDGWNGFHYACNNGYTKVVQLLLQHGKSIGFEFNAKTDVGNTAYILACKKNHQAIVDLFQSEAASNGIDLNIKNNNGKTGDFYLNNR